MRCLYSSTCNVAWTFHPRLQVHRMEGRPSGNHSHGNDRRNPLATVTGTCPQHFTRCFGSTLPYVSQSRFHCRELVLLGYLTERLSYRAGRGLTPLLIGSIYTIHEACNPKYWCSGQVFAVIFVGVAIWAAIYLWRKASQLYGLEMDYDGS